MIADEFCTKFQGKSSFLYFVGKNRNNSHIMWNCDPFDLQYNRIIKKRQVQKQAFYIGGGGKTSAEKRAGLYVS